MSVVGVVFGTIIIAGLGALLACSFHYTRKHMRLLVPGYAARGTPAQPRLLVEGRPVPGPAPLLGPLSGRPCAAWRLDVRYRQVAQGNQPPEWVYIEYGAADFAIEAPTGTVHVHVDGSKIHRFSRDDANSPWIIPRGAEVDSLTVFIMEGQAVVEPESRLSEAGKRQAEARALEQLSRALPADARPYELRVVECVVDLSRDWLCEGPVHVDGDRRTIVSFPSEIPVKLAPRESMMRVKGWEMLPVALILLFFGILLLVVLI